MIRLEGITVTFGRGTPMETTALRGLDLTIPTGQFVTVIGSNGAGKSTVLNVLTGDAPVERRPRRHRRAGRDRLGRRRAAPRSSRASSRTRSPAAAPTSRSRRTWRSRRRAACGAASRWPSTPGVATISAPALNRLGLGLENRLGDRMGLLSGGQRQAVSLLMATLQPMKILLLDEHTAALDPKTAEFVLALTQQIVEEQKLTTLMVTHSMRQALDHGERIVMLHEGSVVLDVAGEERQGLDVPDLLALFAKHRGQTLADDALLLG